MEAKKRENLAKIAMLAATIIWGSSFLVVKNTVDVFPPNLLIASRFTLGCLILSIVFHKRLKKIDKGYLVSGLIIGVFLYLAFAFQTTGIQTTNPGKNAFLTAIYCVVVPFLFWIVARRKPDIFNVLAAVVCIVGIGLVSLTSNFTISPGDALSLVGGVLFACHIVSIARCAEGRDPILLTIMQFGVAAILAWIVSLTTETFSVADITPEGVGGLLYLAVFSTSVGLLLQNIGQKYVHASAAAIILSLESVFGVIFSVIFYGEQLTLRLVLGFALIFLAVVISETKLSFLRRKKKNPSPQLGEME